MDLLGGANHPSCIENGDQQGNRGLQRIQSANEVIYMALSEDPCDPLHEGNRICVFLALWKQIMDLFEYLLTRVLKFFG
jgi:hypothetical protein